MKLPNGKHAYLGDKLEAYSLSFQHREGRHKARVFSSALGITLANADLLRTAVQEAASDSDAALAHGENGFGQIFTLNFPLATAAGLKVTTVFGGVGQNPQVSALRGGIDVLIACPGRLEDLIG